MEYPRKGYAISINFGYDHFIDNYKVIVVSSKGEVCVNTLGTDYWRIIGDIPNDYNISQSGIFVSGTVNWFQSDNSSILSLNLEKESYHELLLPDYENENDQDFGCGEGLLVCLCKRWSVSGCLDNERVWK